jgi:tetraacyldisaccharide 4'-kinase
VSRASDWVESLWYGNGAGAYALLPLAWLFRAGAAARRRAYSAGLLRSGHPGAPVIVVGNITAGGAGKTPIVLWLGRHLAARGWNPAVVSRGYGGRRGDHPEWVSPDSDPADFGDEPVMLARAGLPVAIGRDRLAAAELVAASGAGVILSDDGLQHYALQRDMEIVVIDGTRGLGNGRCLPAGPLREPAGRLHEADVLLCNGGDRCPPGAVSWRLRLGPARALAGDHVRPLTAFSSHPVHAVAGIGNPRRFFEALRRAGLDVLEHPFPDHYGFRQGDLVFDDGLPVLMTSKDAVKARRFGHSGLWEVPAEVDFDGDQGQRLLDGVEARIRAVSAADPT